MKSVAKKRSIGQRIKKLCGDIHLWLGLITGIIVVAVCFSGTVYVYNTELVEWTQPHLYKIEAPKGAERIPVAQLKSQVENSVDAEVKSVFIPKDLNEPYRFSVKKKGEKSRRGTNYMVNPYTGQILGHSKEASWAKTLMGSMFSLHRWLLLDKIEAPLIGDMPNRDLGRAINGYSTLFFTLICISGLVIWFPKKIKNWKQGLKIKASGGWKRINHDLHRTLAFYALIPLLLMGLTGPQWSFSWYRTGLRDALGISSVQKKKEVKPVKTAVLALPNAKTLSVEEMINRVDKALPYQGEYAISFNDKINEPIRLSKYRTGFFAPAASDKIVMNPFSGEIISKEIFKDKPINERIASSIKAIHVGTVYGSFTKLIYFISCLIATSLPITGTIIWLNKLKKKRKKKAKNKLVSSLN